MEKKKLLLMRPLNATSKMMRVVRKDVPKKVTVHLRYPNGYTYERIEQNYQLYLRCCVENGILKAALYYPDNLRTGGRLPSYEVYIDRSAGRFITYDRISGKWREAQLDRLEWPCALPEFPDVWISTADERLVTSYLGSKKRGYEAILLYQRQLREASRMRRYKKETDVWDADLAFSPALPKDWNRWVDKVGIPENFIFYAYQKGGAKQGYCSYCGKDVPIHGIPRHNKQGTCPCCRHEITYKAIGRLASFLDTKEVCVYLIQSRPDGFVVREFWASRRYRRESYKTPEVSCVERWHTIYDHEGNTRTYHWGCYKQLWMRWIAGEPSYSWMSYGSIYLTHGCKDGRVYGKTLPQLAKGPAKRTGLIEWIYAHGLVANPDEYLTVQKRVPQFEQIWKAGLDRLADECKHNPGCMHDLIKAPTSTSLTKALGIGKQALERLRQNHGGCFMLRWLQFEKQSGKPVTEALLDWLCEQKISVSSLSFILDKMNVLQICNYLQRQSADSREPAGQVLTTWRDYLSMAKRLGIDTSDEIIYRARLLRQRHDELVLRCRQQDRETQAMKVLKEFPQVDQVCRSLKAKYEYTNERYAVIAPNGVLDIIVEGDFLCHCLRGSDHYWDRIETHESYILFLRRASAPGIPYYTLEVEPDGTVRQKRTKFNRQEDDIKEAEQFLAEWQKVIARRLTNADRKKSAVSRVLREREFEKLRQDNIVIHTGDLAGQRLVDVLTADLMENAA